MTCSSFANKDRTQEEFFNAFEALLAKKSHIVMTSDTYPKGLANIHDRLVSRFDSRPDGPPEPLSWKCVAILINKARRGCRDARGGGFSSPRTCAPNVRN